MRAAIGETGIIGKKAIEEATTTVEIVAAVMATVESTL